MCATSPILFDQEVDCLGIKPGDGMVITKDVVLEPGTCLLPQGLKVAADHMTIDGQGAVLAGQR